MTEHVVFTEGVPGDELPAHHAMADVFAMPCRTRGAGLDVEGLGIVYLEASATGVPVVAGDSGGAPETVRDGETGLVVDGTDVGADRRGDRRPTRRPRPRRRGWARRAGDGSSTTGSGAPRRSGSRELLDRLVARLRVERLDVAGELLGDHLALDLQRRRQLAGVLGEVDRQDAELADRLGLGHRLVGVLDGQLDLGDQVGILGEVATDASALLAVALLPAGERLGVDGDERGDERLGVADAPSPG